MRERNDEKIMEEGDKKNRLEITERKKKEVEEKYLKKEIMIFLMLVGRPNDFVSSFNRLVDCLSKNITNQRLLSLNCLSRSPISIHD